MSAGYWRRHARRYDRAITILNGKFPRVAKDVAVAMGGLPTVLEVAAGTGLVTVELAARCERLVATDRSEEMLSVLRGRLRDAGYAHVAVQEADALALPFDDGSFDGLVMANLLHLLPSPARALAEARRTLGPGGLLCAPTFCHGEHVLAHVVSRALGLTGFPVVTRFSRVTLVETIATHGFKVERTSHYSGVLPVHLVLAKKS